MNRHEAAFLEGALHIGDPVLERRLLLGYGVINALIARLEDAQPGACQTAGLLEGEMADVFADAPTHLERLRSLAAAIDAREPSRRDIHAALVDYACLIALEDHTECALAAISLSERIWDDSCSEEAALRAFYRYSVIMVRGQKQIAECEELCLLLASRARRAKSALFRGFARLLQVDVLMYRGLPKARVSAKRVLAYGIRTGIPELVSQAHMRLAAIAGRAGAFEDALAHGAAAYESGEHDRLLRQNALNLMGRALIDLGRLDDARRALELASVSERSAVRTLIMLGLMDLALLTGELSRFEQLRARVASGPIAPAHRMYYLKLAALGAAAAGESAEARRLLEEGRQLARTSGFSFEYLDLDAELTKLSEREETARRTRVRLASSTHVEAIAHEIERDHRAAAGAMQWAMT